jgi:hypothetical protein
MTCFRDMIEEYINKMVKDPAEKEKVSKLLLKDLEKHLEEIGLSYDISIESLKAREDFRLKLSDAFYGMIPENTRDKGFMKKRVLAFAEHLRKTWKVDFVLDEAFKLEVMNKYERQVDLLKTLNSGKTKVELEQYYSLSRKPLEKDIDELVMGTRILGQKVKIRDIKREHKAITYQSSIHPIFMPLNLTEVYYLTVGLKMLSNERDTIMGQTLENISNRVYCQLSDCARKKIDKKAIESGISFPYEEELERYNGCWDEEEMARDNLRSTLAYIWKAGIQCTIHLKNEAMEVIPNIYIAYDISTNEVFLKESPEGNRKRKLDIDEILDIKYLYL